MKKNISVHFSHPRNCQGFTLIEVLIATALISVVSMIFVSNSVLANGYASNLDRQIMSKLVGEGAMSLLEASHDDFPPVILSDATKILHYSKCFNQLGIAEEPRFRLSIKDTNTTTSNRCASKSSAIEVRIGFTYDPSAMTTAYKLEVIDWKSNPPKSSLISNFVTTSKL